MATTTGPLPILDISRLRGTVEDRTAFLAELRDAAHDVGFCYVVGHGVPAEVTEGIFGALKRFFELPVERRLEIENVNSPQFRGYTRTGAEHTGGTPDWREQIDVGPELPARTVGEGDPAWLRLIGPNQWPPALPELRDATLDWQAEALRVSQEVLRALAAALGQDERYFDTWFDEEAATHLKLIHYPGTTTSDQGVGAHKDYGYLALLQQDDIGGLQVQTEDGDRYSAAFFLAPRLDAVVEPLTLPAELAARARGISDDPDNPLLAAYGDNALLGWLRSHPRVAERWWSDVLTEH